MYPFHQILGEAVVATLLATQSPGGLPPPQRPAQVHLAILPDKTWFEPRDKRKKIKEFRRQLFRP